MKQKRSGFIRHVDKIPDCKETIQKPMSSKIEIWERAWLACANVLGTYSGLSLKEYHFLIEKWMPIINKAHNFPIQKLFDYEPFFIYCDKSNAPKEIISIYLDVQSTDVEIPMYIVFNTFLFRKLLNIYISLNSKSNQMNFDLDRGIISLSNNNFLNMQPAEYFKISSSWYILFLAVNHALAHLENFEKYDTASYNDHAFIKRSSFYKMHLYGRIKHVLN